MEMTLATAEIDEDETLSPLVDAAAELDVRWVDLLHPRNTAAEGLERTLARLAGAGVRVSAIGTTTRLGDETDDVTAHRRALADAIRVAADIGCGYVNTYFGTRSSVDDATAVEDYRRNLEPCLGLAEDRAVTITLENEFDAAGEDPLGSDLTRRAESVRGLMEAVDSARFRFAFDACNAYFADVEGFPAYFEVIRPFIGYVHVKDGRRRAGSPDPRWKDYDDHGRRYRTCELGTGALNWHGLLAGLTADGYGGFLCLEPHAVPGHRAAAWRQAVDFLRPYAAAANGS
jgi:sugar phosphate isomerase/epimerase